MEERAVTHPVATAQR